MPFNLVDFPEAFQFPFRCSRLSAWTQHLPLAPILVKLLRPRVFVELGTHGGDSYLAFCNAVRTLGTGTQCTAVDTWTGDAHTGPYGPEILAELRSIHDPNFGAFSRLMQSTFDAAAAVFAGASIDLLHIDGGHTYEAVMHDYQTWLPKMSPRGVVLFHDTTVRDFGFGVWKAWEEIAAGRPASNLPHGYGLGIVAVGGEPAAELLEFLDELNRRPPLVKALETLGNLGHFARAFAGTVGNLQQCQAVTNEWRQRTGQAVLTPASMMKIDLSNVDSFGAGVVRDVRQMELDAAALGQEVMQLRAGQR